MAAEGEELDINTEVDESMTKEGEGAAETDPDAVCLGLYPELCFPALLP